MRSPCRSWPCLETEFGRRGVAIVVILLLLAMVMGITAAAGLLVQQNYTNGHSRERQLKAKYAFRAGLNTVMAVLSEDPLWNPTKASPHEEFLDPAGEVGFRVWFDGINRDSDLPLTTPSGLRLEKGQAAVWVEPLVGGEVVSAGFGGLQARALLVRPPIEYEHALFSTSDAGGLDFNQTGGVVLSYDSKLPVPVFDPTTGPVPLQNRDASIRALNSVDLERCEVHQEVVLPPDADMTVSGHTGTTTRLAELYLPRKFTPPDGWKEQDAVFPAVSPGVPTAVPPGMYSEVTVPAGSHLVLEHGGVYGFPNLTLGANTSITVGGDPADGPCTVFTHSFYSGRGSRLNLPASGVPQPENLQMYGLYHYECSVSDFHFEQDSQAALLASGSEAGEINLESGAVIYGSLIAHELNVKENAQVHYDTSLRTLDEFEAQTEWILLNQGLR